MDMVAAIQAAKNQLEEQKKKKGITQPTTSPSTNLPSISSLHPAPPTNIVSFDSNKKQRASPHPYHANQADYIHPDFQYKSNNNNTEEDDELTTTSSLSGTLPSSVVHDIPHNIHKSESGLSSSNYNRSESGLSNSGFGLDTVKESPGSYTNNTGRSKSFIVADSPKVEIDEDVTPNRRSKSLYVKDMPGLPLKRGTTADGDSNTGGNVVAGVVGTTESNKGQSVLGALPDNNNNTAASSKDNANVSKRIDEIMSAYQGKVDTILKRRDEGASFKSIMESASAQQGGGGSTSVASSVSKRSNAEGLVIDDIMTTYKKKVGEIMEKSQQANAAMSSNSSNGSTKNTYDDDMEMQRQEMSSRSRPSYPRSIVDDETTESREGAIDKSVGGSHASRGGRSRSPSYSRSSSRGSSYSGSRSYTGSESCSEDGTRKGDETKDGATGAAAAPMKKSAGPMSERANAIWQSLDAKQPSEGNNDDNRSVYSEGSYSTHGSQSYISGASSASNALGSTYSREYAKDDQPQDKQEAEESNSSTSQRNENPNPLLRKDSLRQAQEQLARKLPQSTKSFYCEPNSTKSNLHAEIETERKYRQDMERRLAESTQREEDLSNENRRIEKTLADLQSQLDKVQGDARSNKYSQSEQAARIRELERKLKGEQNRVEELEREKDAMKEEVSVVWTILTYF